MAARVDSKTMAADRAVFAARLRRFMAKRQPHMTQYALARLILKELGEPVEERRARSVESLISKWLAGKTTPSKRYTSVLCAIFNVTAIELGLRELGPGPAFPPHTIEEDDELQALVAPYETAALIGPSDVDKTRRSIDDLRVEDRGGVSNASDDLLAAQLTRLQHLADYSLSPATRRHLLSALADAAGMRGWQLLNAGRLKEADATFRLGERAAHEGDDLAAYAFLRAEHGYVLADAGLLAKASQLVETTADVFVGHVPNLLSTWLHAAAAEMVASLGDRAGCARRLELAHRTFERSDIAPEVPYVVLDEHHLERWAGSSLARLADHRAIDLLLTAERALEPEFVRARAALLADLVSAFTAAGELAEAAALFVKAYSLAHHAGTKRQLVRLRGLYGTLFPSGEALAS
jgi:tetratricopeptide (TPR) repeat protein